MLINKNIRLPGRVHRFRVFGILCLSCWAAFGANVTAQQSGLWGVASTWVGGRIPGAGDTINIPDGIKVIAQGPTAIGTSATGGTVAVNLNCRGQLEVFVGAVLQVRGDIVYSTGDNCSTWAVQVDKDSALEFDSSLAVSPFNTHYAFGPSGPHGYRPFIVAGEPDHRAIVRSNAGGGAGIFSSRGNSGAVGHFKAAYADFIRIGDSSNPGWVIGYQSSGHAILWDVTYSTFTSCGSIEQAAGTFGVESDGVFRHSYNIHYASASPQIFGRWINYDGYPLGTGTREFRNNVFDVSLSRAGFQTTGFTFWSNYIADAMATGGGGWASWRGNIIRYTDWWAQTGSALGIMGDMLDTYIFVDSDWGNPKPVISSAGVVGNLQGVIFGQAGTANGTPGLADSGELFFNIDPLSPQTYKISHTILLPNMSGYSSMAIGAWGGFPNMIGSVEHSVWFGGYGASGPGDPSPVFGFPALQVGEGYNPIPGQIASFRGNIVWNPNLPGYTNYARFAKIGDIGNGWNNTNASENPCLPANCDYNTGFNHTPVNPNAAQYDNQGHGYIARFSSPPGEHDVDDDPKFVDFQRSLELFDSKYIGNTPDAWSQQATYNLGEMVQSTDPVVYWNLPVNFRYLGCGTNPKPGVDAGWRDCWEFATLHRIRLELASGQTYDDPSIGANADGILLTIMKWIRAGYSATNPLLVGAAHDGTDIGAMPVSFPAPGGNQ